MTKYRGGYIETHCIDLFFDYKGLPIHILTNGNTLPDSLNNKELNRKIQRVVTAKANWNDQSEDGIIVNETYVDFVSGAVEKEHSPSRSTILRLFVPIAKLGFYSYVCIEMKEQKSHYMLVARPSEQIGKQELQERLPIFDAVSNIKMRDGIITEFWTI